VLKVDVIPGTIVLESICVVKKHKGIIVLFVDARSKYYRIDSSSEDNVVSLYRRSNTLYFSKIKTPTKIVFSGLPNQEDYRVISHPYAKYGFRITLVQDNLKPKLIWWNKNV
jgi:hypothetical protein